jgi:hypothetical protein
MGRITKQEFTDSLKNELEGKLNSSSKGNLTEATSSILTITGGTGATIGNVSVQVKQASGSQSGYLSSTDWTTFNNKQPAGSYLTSETQLSKGTTSGSGNAVTDISLSNHTITLIKGTTFLTSETQLSINNATGDYVSDVSVSIMLLRKPKQRF